MSLTWCGITNHVT